MTRSEAGAARRDNKQAIPEGVGSDAQNAIATSTREPPAKRLKIMLRLRIQKTGASRYNNTATHDALSPLTKVANDSGCERACAEVLEATPPSSLLSSLGSTPSPPPPLERILLHYYAVPNVDSQDNPRSAGQPHSPVLDPDKDAGAGHAKDDMSRGSAEMPIDDAAFSSDSEADEWATISKEDDPKN